MCDSLTLTPVGVCCWCAPCARTKYCLVLVVHAISTLYVHALSTCASVYQHAPPSNTTLAGARHCDMPVQCGGGAAQGNARGPARHVIRTAHLSFAEGKFDRSLRVVSSTFDCSVPSLASARCTAHKHTHKCTQRHYVLSHICEFTLYCTQVFEAHLDDVIVPCKLMIPSRYTLNSRLLPRLILDTNSVVCHSRFGLWHTTSIANVKF